MSLAEVIPIKRSEEGQRVADIDDGYTRIANELLDAVMLAGLTQYQLLVFMAVLRKTYGFNKKSDWISNEQFHELTGILPHKCSAAKNELVRRKILLVSKRQTGINKVVSEWLDKPYPIKVTLPNSGKKILPDLGNRPYPIRVTTKDNITKDNKDNIKPPIPPLKILKPKIKSFDPKAIKLPEWLSAETWSLWVRYRREIKKPIKSALTVEQAIKLLDRCVSAGWTPEEIINRSIANQWIGLFEPKESGVSQSSCRMVKTDNFSSKDYGQTEEPSWVE